MYTPHYTLHFTILYKTGLHYREGPPGVYKIWMKTNDSLISGPKGGENYFDQTWGGGRDLQDVS